jgi:ABC-type nitrate/sulfonate/bicarbonate transport system permease component
MEKAIESQPASVRALAAKPWRSVGLNVVSVIAFLVVWHLTASIVKSPFFPTPWLILQAFVTLATQGDTMGNSLWQHCWASLYRVLVGFAAGVVLGVPLGLTMGLHPGLYAATRSIVEPFRFIPPIAWIPLAIIFFTGLTRFAFLIFIGAFFPVFTATLVGVARVEPIHRKVAVVYGASRYYVLARIVLPTVMPDIMGGMRIALGAAWLTIVAAELSGGTSLGLGRMMVNYAELLQIPQIVVGMVLIGALGFAMNEVLLIFERRMFRWRWQVKL